MNSSDNCCSNKFSGQQFSFVVGVDEGGARLDHFLVQKNPAESRSFLNTLIRSGRVLIDGQCRKSSYRLKGGEVVAISVPDTVETDLLPDAEVFFEILLEDPYLLVLSKPPGLVVHPGIGNLNGTLVNGLIHHCRSIIGVGDKVRPGIVHRLDKDTSGIMLVAKQDLVHRKLVEAFKARKVEKYYYALLHGIIAEKVGRIVAPIGRHPVSRQKMAVREREGRYAASSYQIVEEFAQGFSLARIKIETGRTHQIRVHMAQIGHPVAGDKVYGPNRNNAAFPRQLLHASQISFVHPVTAEELKIDAPIWPDFSEILADFRTNNK